MSNNTQLEEQEALKSAKKFTFSAYILYFIGVVTGGIFSTLGLILAYVRRKALVGTIYHNHLSYLIRTYWFFIGFQILGLITINLRGIGIIILIITYIWYLYRLVSGFTKLSDNRAV